jgi:hypothetical protein
MKPVRWRIVLAVVAEAAVDTVVAAEAATVVVVVAAEAATVVVAAATVVVAAEAATVVVVAEAAAVATVVVAMTVAAVRTTAKSSKSSPSPGMGTLSIKGSEENFRAFFLPMAAWHLTTSPSVA